jgi:hypothetical protein
VTGGETREPAPAHAEAPAPRGALTVRGEEISHAELQLAAEVSRFPRRFGLKVPVDGFLAWRAYVALRALWRLRERLRRSR